LREAKGKAVGNAQDKSIASKIDARTKWQVKLELEIEPVVQNRTETKCSIHFSIREETQRPRSSIVSIANSQ
jgi:hypothetical protein